MATQTITSDNTAEVVSVTEASYVSEVDARLEVIEFRDGTAYHETTDRQEVVDVHDTEVFYEATVRLEAIEVAVQGTPGPAAFASPLPDNTMVRVSDGGFYVPPQMVWTDVSW